MRLKKLLLLFLGALFIIHHHPVHANNVTNQTIGVQLNNSNTTGGNIVCVDLADFFYEIILGVSAFPQQGDCNDQEDAEIAALLQSIVNAELRAVPGTVNTENKVCSNPINDRRLQLVSPRENNKSNTSMMRTLRSSSSKEQHDDERNLLHKERRSFIYIGGGRCRFCFFDNMDQRALLPTSKKKKRMKIPLPLRAATHEDHRNLLSFHHFSRDGTIKSFPKVADILLCKDFQLYRHKLNPVKPQKYEKWTNNETSIIDFKDLSRDERGTVVLGPLIPKESFGIQFIATEYVDATLQYQKHFFRQKLGRDGEFQEQPVKEGTIYFSLYLFDLPSWALPPPNGFLDVPFILYINGLKLDFNLLMAEPKTRKFKTNKNDILLSGNSFAGIRWTIMDSTESRFGSNKDFAEGPEPDGYFEFIITAPLVVLAHKNQLDLDFIMKPEADATSFGFNDFHIHFNVAKCEVTDLENSPFQDFKSVVESRLFHKLGMGLAHEFQGKKGHCLYDKLPVVDIHLIEKESWRDSNPRCGN